MAILKYLHTTELVWYYNKPLFDETPYGCVTNTWHYNRRPQYKSLPMVKTLCLFHPLQISLNSLPKTWIYIYQTLVRTRSSRWTFLKKILSQSCAFSALPIAANFPAYLSILDFVLNRTDVSIKYKQLLKITHCRILKNIRREKEIINFVSVADFASIQVAARSKAWVRQLACWECRFHSHRGHGCLLWVLCVVR